MRRPVGARFCDTATDAGGSLRGGRDNHGRCEDCEKKQALHGCSDLGRCGVDMRRRVGASKLSVRESLGWRPLSCLQQCELGRGVPQEPHSVQYLHVGQATKMP